MNTIDSYHFGEIVISGEKYSSDVIIFPDRVQSGWRRRQSHEVSPGDIAGILNESPEVLIVGTGAWGLVKVLPEVAREVKERNIKFIAEPTGEACKRYNQLSQSQRAVAALHLTC